MIHFTDITGLASSAIAMTAAAVMLPGVARLQKTHFALLICAIAIAVLIPFGGLPLAAYVRGWIGDLSITSLVLLMMAILRPVYSCLPSGKSNAPSPCTGEGWVTNDLAVVVGQPSQMASSSIREGGRQALLLLMVIAAAALYPMALGLGFFDPYRLGYGNTWLLGGLFLLALLACFRKLPVVALAVALAVFAWGVGWYESGNLWDYLLDPLLAIYAMGALLKRGMKSLLKSRRD